MTDIRVSVIQSTPMIRINGPITSRSGKALANEIMAAIHFDTEDGEEYIKPLALEKSRVPAT